MNTRGRLLRLEGDDSVDAIRAFRSILHGLVALEAEGPFAFPADPNQSFDRLVHGFVIALAHWTDLTAPEAAIANGEDHK